MEMSRFPIAAIRLDSHQRPLVWLQGVVCDVSSAFCRQQSLLLTTALLQLGVISRYLVIAHIRHMMYTEVVVHLLQFCINQSDGVVEGVVSRSLVDVDDDILSYLPGLFWMNQGRKGKDSSQQNYQEDIGYGCLAFHCL